MSAVTTAKELKVVMYKYMWQTPEGCLETKEASWDVLAWAREIFPRRDFTMDGTILRWSVNPEVQRVNRQKDSLFRPI